MNRNHLLLLTSALLSLILTGCGDEDAGNKQRAPQNIVAYQVKSGVLEHQIHAVGSAKANESVNITSKIAGRLEKVLFEDGQLVAKEDILVQLDQDEEQAQLSSARVQLSEHQREIKRLKTLLERHAAPVRDLDERKTLAAITQNSIKELEARLAEMTLRAPFDGKIGISRVSPGTLIQPGTVIASLDQSNPIKVDFSIPSTQLQGIAPGNPISATTAAMPDVQFSGQITALDSRIDPATGSLMIRAQLDNSANQIIPGMLLSISVSQTPRSAILIPEEAITQKQEKHFVTVIAEDQTAQIRPIHIGVRSYGSVEVTGGLKDGETIVVRGMEFVKPGAKVNITEILNAEKPGQQTSATAEPYSQAEPSTQTEQPKPAEQSGGSATEKPAQKGQ